mgnify:CR=1 FL=1|jgi:hypothetical protein
MENKDILNSSTHAGRNQYGSWALYEGNSAHIQNQKMTTADASFSSKDSLEKLAKAINPAIMLLALNWADRGVKSW